MGSWNLRLVLRLEEVLDAKFEETEQKVAELSAFRENLLYYRRRAGVLHERLPVERTCKEASFCGCLEAVIEAEGDERDNQR